MSTLAVSPSPLAFDVSCTEDELVVHLADGRVLSVPLAWFPRLFDATGAQRAHWELLGNGEGIHWPDEVNRLSDAEQTALLEEVGQVLDKALIAKVPGVHIIKWSFADTCRVKPEALRFDLWNYIFGGGS